MPLKSSNVRERFHLTTRQCLVIVAGAIFAGICHAAGADLWELLKQIAGGF
jgi:hypothetical protein